MYLFEKVQVSHWLCCCYIGEKVYKMNMQIEAKKKKNEEYEEEDEKLQDRKRENSCKVALGECT